MNYGDTPTLIVYPPENLSDESVHAISELLCEMCRSFEQQYYRQITRHHKARQAEALERKYTGNKSENDEPF